MRTGIFGWALLALLGWNAAAAGKLQVVTTLPDYGAIAQEVGGKEIEVTSLARGTEDPHFVDNRPSYIRILNRADLLIEGGADLELGWLPPLVNNARNAKILGAEAGHLLLSRGVRMLDVPAGPIDRSMGDVHPAGNPHYHLDPANGSLLATNIAESLARLDSKRAEMYWSNARSFSDRLQAKLATWSKALEPFRGTKVVTYHKSFDYLLDRFGLVLVATIEPRPGIEPSPTHINNLIPRMKAAEVKLILCEPFRPRKTATRLAEATGARLVLLPGSVGGAEKVTDYLSLFDYNVRQLTQALEKR